MALIRKAKPVAAAQGARRVLFSAHDVITTMLCILFAIMYLDRVNISAAARQGVAEAVRAAMARSDREAYLRHPEHTDTFWTEAEEWGKP